MQWTSVIAIYALFWVLCAFLVMPFGLRTPNEVDGYKGGVGHAESAPTNFRPGRIALRATVLSTVVFGLFYLNYLYGWISVEDLNFFPEPPNMDKYAY